jgi:hypothetical protein
VRKNWLLLRRTSGTFHILEDVLVQPVESVLAMWQAGVPVHEAGVPHQEMD